MSLDFKAMNPNELHERQDTILAELRALDKAAGKSDLRGTDQRTWQLLNAEFESINVERSEREADYASKSRGRQIDADLSPSQSSGTGGIGVAPAVAANRTTPSATAITVLLAPNFWLHNAVSIGLLDAPIA